MKLMLFRYWCDSCNKWFEAPNIGNVYGHFVLHSISGEIRYLDAISDCVFEEVSELIKKDSRVYSVDEFKQAEILHEIFGIACDPDTCGNEFRMGVNRTCPYCKRDTIDSWEAVDPTTYVNLDILPITHNQWNQLNWQEKNDIIRKAIDSSSII